MRAVLIALCAVLALAGCGSHKSQRANDYVHAVNRAENDFAARFHKLEPEITRQSSPKQIRSTLLKFELAIDRVVAQLRGVRPPDSVRSLHAELIAAIAAYRDPVDQARRAFGLTDRKKLNKTRTSLQRSFAQIGARITRTTNAINTKLHG